MEIKNVSKNKILNELAGNFVQAQEKENPSTYSNLTELELKMKESCIAKIIDENGKETYQSDNKNLSKIFETKMADRRYRTQRKGRQTVPLADIGPVQPGNRRLRHEP